MDASQLPFPAAWWGIDLPGHRGCYGTYCLYPFESIPPLGGRRFSGEFDWVPDLDDALGTLAGVYWPPAEERTRMARRLEGLTAAAGELGLELPPAFVKFMGAPGLQNRIPSCTACYFDLPERVVPAPSGAPGYLVRFMNDQQDVLLWYLYLDAQGNQAVLVSPIPYDGDSGDGPPSPQEMRDNTWFCGEDFEAFLYRWWLENTLWFALSEEGRTLTEEQRRYVSHYPAA